jgi:hypothetical protein
VRVESRLIPIDFPERELIGLVAASSAVEGDDAFFSARDIAQLSKHRFRSISVIGSEGVANGLDEHLGLADLSHGGWCSLQTSVRCGAPLARTTMSISDTKFLAGILRNEMASGFSPAQTPDNRSCYFTMQKCHVLTPADARRTIQSKLQLSCPREEDTKITILA